jgi:hypothetical protein
MVSAERILFTHNARNDIFIVEGMLIMINSFRISDCGMRIVKPDSLSYLRKQESMGVLAEKSLDSGSRPE